MSKHIYPLDMNTKIAVIGAGIGGLTTAIALKKKGFDVRVYEQANIIKPVGAGIVLATNAMQVYQQLGLRAEIEASGNYVARASITDKNLRSISNMDLKYFEEKYGVRNVAVHRGRLQQVLAEKLTSRELQLGHPLVEVVRENDVYRLRFRGGRAGSASVLIGADGLNSVVRRCLFPRSPVRSAKQVCWRGVVRYTLPKAYQHTLHEAWGKGDRVGFVQIARDQVYWFAVKTFKRHASEYPIEELGSYFEDYHPLIRALISETSDKNVHTAQILDLQPMKQWYQENVCLVGDAAHATTPNMGQGACQAIEDAYVLSACLGKYEVSRAFSEYQQLRMEKAHRVVKTSWLLGQVAHASNPLLMMARNQLLRLTPPSVNRKQMEKIFQLASV